MIRSVPMALALFSVTLLTTACSGDAAPESDHARRVAEALESDPAGERWIKDDWTRAEREARESGRPIFALFRCVP